MPRPVGGEQHRRNIAALRAGGFALAVALGAVAIWLIVTSSSQKRIEIGVLTGLWGLLVGAYSVFGSRQNAHPPAPAEQAVDVRPGTELQTVDSAAALREFQAGLEKIVQREIGESVSRELAGLRAEVASLRGDLLEKVDGQIRLERIETTRLIGSDLEALQAEVRQLRLRQLAELDVLPVQPVVIQKPPVAVPAPAPVPVQPMTPQPAAAQPPPPPQPMRPQQTSVPLAPFQQRPAQPAPAQAAPSAPQPTPTHDRPTTRLEPVSEEVPPPTAPAPAPPAPQPSDDPFASMPRLRPFTDIDLDPVEPPTAISIGSNGAPAPARHDAAPAPVGRRHRGDDDGNDVLARILARENSAP